ncbi:hypothetical protein JXA02_01505 [candidate division KSB1 bacterium]|nr:hypothetical protein [candidate division KSB1 bacterium]
MLRLLFLGLALYISARVVGSLMRSPKSTVDVKGHSKKESLDLSKEDVEDVDYKEIK